MANKVVVLEFGADTLHGSSGIVTGTPKTRIVQRCECGGSIRTHCVTCRAPLCGECVDEAGICDVCVQDTVNGDFAEYPVN